MTNAHNLTRHFPHVKMQGVNPLLLNCMNIAKLHRYIQEDAQAHDGYARDKAGQITGLDPQRYAPQIQQIISLFDNIQHSTTMNRYGRVMARDSAQRLKHHPAVMDLRAQWTNLPERERMKGLRLLSDTMIEVMNESDPVLLFHPPVMGASDIAPADTVIAMQVQQHQAPHQPHDFTLITINRSSLRDLPFNHLAAMLWHEHQHIYMSGLRDAYQRQQIKQDHPLYEDAVRSHTIGQYKITGNIKLSTALYRAEPEERLCYFTQDIFENNFRVVSQAPKLKAA